MFWFVAAGFAWGTYLDHRAAEARLAQAAALSAATVREIARIEGLAAHLAPPDAALAARVAEVSAARLLADVSSLSFERFEAAPRERARAQLAHRLVELGYDPEIQAFPTGLNIVGDRPGSVRGAPFVLVGAHLDTVQGSPGADDNATGLAAALELARLFRAPTPRGLRIVFFDREEQGLEGSRRYAGNPSRVSDLSVAIVFDMLGARCRAAGCQRYPADAPIRPRAEGDFLLAIGDVREPALLSRFRAAGGRRVAGGPGRPDILALPVLDGGAGLPDTRRSDHAPFWDAGLPAVLLTDTGELRNPRYHAATDLPTEVDLDFLAGNVASIAEVLGSLLAEPVPENGPEPVPENRQEP